MKTSGLQTRRVRMQPGQLNWQPVLQPVRQSSYPSVYNPDTDLLFPPRLLPALRDLRGTSWQELVTTVMATGPDSSERVAIVLMMARLTNCATCNSASYRAMNGCTSCAKQSLKRCHESDQALTEIFRTTQDEVKNYLQNKSSHNQNNPSDHIQK